MDDTAINKIVTLALAAAGANRIDAVTPAIILDGQIKPLEHLQAGRSRFRGKFVTPVLSEFATYIRANRASAGHGFIDAKACSARVFLNLGTPDAPGHADWTATLALEPTAAYAAIQAIEGQPLAQKQLVEWIEDWSAQLTAKFGENDEPTGIAGAVAAIRQLTISAKSDTTHTDKDFGASLSKFEEIEAKAAGGIPSHLLFECTPYLGFQSRELRLRLSVLTGEKPALVLRIVAREALEEEIAREFKARLLEEVGDAATLTIGSFAP